MVIHTTVSYTNIKLPHFPNILRSILKSFYFKIFKINFGSETFSSITKLTKLTQF